MRKLYFQTSPDSPPPLRFSIERQVRFDEVDSMGIVWHGRYVNYFEEARVALGHNYGISYSDFIHNRIPVPIRQMQIDYYEPLHFEDKITIEAIVHWSEATRLNMEYIIRKAETVACCGSTVQMMLNERFEVLLWPPPFYVEFMEQWKKGALV
jgi:acyl-CoA thioester hydrolase